MCAIILSGSYIELEKFSSVGANIYLTHASNGPSGSAALHPFAAASESLNPAVSSVWSLELLFTFTGPVYLRVFVNEPLKTPLFEGFVSSKSIGTPQIDTP